jgi:hypothetical protein
VGCLVSPTRPDPVKIRSAIVIVELEDGSTMQAILTPTEWQPVEVSMDKDIDFDDWRLEPMEGESRPIWTVTVKAGGYNGQLRTAGATAEQVGPRAVARRHEHRYIPQPEWETPRCCDCGAPYSEGTE